MQNIPQSTHYLVIFIIITFYMIYSTNHPPHYQKENPILANSLMKFLGLLAIVLVVLGALTIAMAGVLVPFAMFRFMLAYLNIKKPGVNLWK